MIASIKAHLKMIFSMMDENHNGFITEKEFMHACRNYQNITESQLSDKRLKFLYLVFHDDNPKGIRRFVFKALWMHTLAESHHKSQRRYLKKRALRTLMHANKREEVQEAYAGDIVALVGLKNTTTGQTLCLEKSKVIYDLMEFPETVISLAIEPNTSADEKKLNLALGQLKLEDPSFSFKENKETGQLLIYGMGELHLDIIVDRLKRSFSVGIRVGKPQVSYREGVLSQGESEYTHSVDLAGKKQFGSCALSVQLDESINGVEFTSKLNKKDLPKEFVEAIGEGVLEAAPGGIIAGYPLTNIKVLLERAKFIEEEASEVAYKIAAAHCIREACSKARVAILEPIMHLEVVTPLDFTGDVISDINGKRGRVINITSKGGKEVIEAEAPLAELFGYSTALRSRTQGRGSFSMSFVRYAALQNELEKKFFEERGISINL